MWWFDVKRLKEAVVWCDEIKEGGSCRGTVLVERDKHFGRFNWIIRFFFFLTF